MEAKTSTWHSINPSNKMFLIVAAAIVVGLAIFGGYKLTASSNSAPATSAVQQSPDVRTLSPQEIIAELNDLLKNKIGDIQLAGFENISFSWHIEDKDAPYLGDDKSRLQWANWIASNPGFCNELNAGQSQPINGCDALKDGQWTYSLTPAEARQALKNDVDSYNNLASQLPASSLKPLAVPQKLNDEGDPTSN